MTRLLVLAFLAVAACQAHAAQWIASQRAGNIVHVLVDAPAEIRRYDLAAGTWLAAAPVRPGPTALFADTNRVYVAYGNSTYRYQPDLTGETHVLNTGAPVRSIVGWSNFVYLVYPSYPYGYISSVRRADDTEAAQVQYTYKAFAGASVSPVLGRIYGREQGISPSDIDTAPLSANGAIGGAVDSPYHGAYPDAQATFVLADGLRVTDSSGTIYNGDNLTFAGSFGGRVDAIDFLAGGTPVVLRGTNVIAFSQTYLPTGSRPTTLAEPKAVFAAGTNVVVLGIAGDATVAERFAASELKPEDPGQGIDPRGVAYTPDRILVDKDGTLLLFSKSLRSVFRWSRAARAHAPTIPLSGLPTQAAYSPANHRLYVGQDSGQIDRIDLGGDLRQVPFANAGATVLGLSAADAYLFACVAISPWVSHQTYTPAGTLVSSRPWNYFSRDYVWCAPRRQMFHFRDDTSPNDLLTEDIGTDGSIGQQVDSPYHGEVNARHPIRVSPDARIVVIGSGEVYDAATLTKAGNLGTVVADAAWRGKDLLTAREVAGVTVVESRGTNTFAPAKVRQLPGTPIRLVADAQGIVLVTLQDATPRFHVLDDDLGVVFSSPVPPAAPDGLAAAKVGPDAVTLAWNDRSDNEDVFEVEWKDPASDAWKPLATLAANATSYEALGLSFATTNTFRVRASNAAGTSAYAGPLAVRTLPDPRIPPAAANLAVVQALGTSIELAWEDRSSNEDGFRVERRSGNPAGAWQVVARLAPNATGYADANLPKLVRQEYRVVAFNAFADGEPSNAAAATTLSSDTLPPNAAPSLLRVASVAPNRVELAWADAASNESGFIVERSTSPLSTWTEVGRTGRNVAAFADDGVAPVSRYSYRVAAYNAAGRSFASATVVAATPGVGGDYLGIAARSGRTVFFAFSGPNRLERYDLAARAWLAPRPLSDKPTAVHAAADGLYAAFGRKIVRLGDDGATETQLGGTTTPANILFASGDFLYAVGTGNDVLWINRRTDTLGGIGSLGFYSLQPGVALAADGGLLFGVTANVSPSDILRFVVPAAGGVPTGKDSPYHGTYPTGSWAALAPDGRRVMTSAGIVYNAGDLTYAGTLSGAVDAAAFTTNASPVVARGRVLLGFDRTFAEVGRAEVDAAPVRLEVDGGDVLAFVPDGQSPRGLAPRTVPLADVVPPASEQPPRLAGLAFEPDATFLSADGDTLLLASRQFQMLFRWSVSGRRELPAIAFRDAPSFVAYSAPSNRVFTAYATGEIFQLDVADGATERPFARTPLAPQGLACPGEFVLAVDYSGAWCTHYVFAPSGTLVQSAEWNYISREYTWNPAIRRAYFFRDGVSPNDLHWEGIGTDGHITGAGETPYHGEVITQYPIRVKPDGSVVVIGSGQMFATSTMTFSGVLSNPVADAAWNGGTLLTLRALADGTQVQRWSATLAPTPVAQVAGKPLRLWRVAGGYLVLALEEGQPRVTLLDDVFATTYASPINHAPLAVALDGGPVPENAPAGTVVGSLRADDPDAGDTVRFALVGGATDALRVAGTNLVTTRPLDFEATPTLSVTVRAMDSHGLSVSQPIVVSVQNVNEPPTGISISNATLREEAPVGTTVGILAAADPDAGDAHAFVLLDDAGGRFAVLGNRLAVAAPMRYRDDPRPRVRVRATDKGGASVESDFVVALVALPEPSFVTRVVGADADQLLWSDVFLPKLSFGMQYQADTSSNLRDWTPLLIPATPLGSTAQGDTLRYILPASGNVRFLRIRRVYP